MLKESPFWLQGLTRLRLLANHPLLMDPAYEGGSGKFDEIIMRFETLKSENHKVLIFSSFVKHLHLLANHFDKENWKYAWLSGSTSGTDREKEINKFMQESDVNCFLISLNRGGGVDFFCVVLFFFLRSLVEPCCRDAGTKSFPPDRTRQECNGLPLYLWKP